MKGMSLPFLSSLVFLPISLFFSYASSSILPLLPPPYPAPVPPARSLHYLIALGTCMTYRVQQEPQVREVSELRVTVAGHLYVPQASQIPLRSP